MSSMIKIRILEGSPLVEAEMVVLPDDVKAGPVVVGAETPKSVTVLLHPQTMMALRRVLYMSFQEGAEADAHRIIAEIAVKTASDYDTVFALIADSATRSPESFLSVAQAVLDRVCRDFGANGFAALEEPTND